MTLIIPARTCITPYTLPTNYNDLGLPAMVAREGSTTNIVPARCTIDSPGNDCFRNGRLSPRVFTLEMQGLPADYADCPEFQTASVCGGNGCLNPCSIPDLTIQDPLRRQQTQWSAMYLNQLEYPANRAPDSRIVILYTTPAVDLFTFHRDEVLDEDDWPILDAADLHVGGRRFRLEVWAMAPGFDQSLVYVTLSYTLWRMNGEQWAGNECAGTHHYLHTFNKRFPAAMDLKDLVLPLYKTTGTLGWPGGPDYPPLDPHDWTGSSCKITWGGQEDGVGIDGPAF